MRVTKFSILFLLLFSLIFPSLQVNAQTSSPGQIFVSQTGHFVRGEFLKTYISNTNYLTIFGYPITDEIIDPTNGQTVQYFQRARFDLIKDNQGMHIEIAPLGSLLYQAGGEVRSDLSNSNKCRYFEPTGKSVCLSFLDFYEQNQGDIYFGYPISDFEIHDGLLVQYFEKARLEWHPEKSAGEKITLTDLGRLYFDARVGDPLLLEPAPSNNLIGESTRINVQALVGSDEPEIVYMVVQDQFLNPIQGAGLSVIITHPDGKKEAYRPIPTNLDGISKLEIPVKDLPPYSVVNIEVNAVYQKLQTSTTTWFRVW
ncbi:MAG: hypothetical protein LWX83_12460 [Anaerolineae bacterium]|nr:hypothetical protein [Anaerolineae bacterium]